MCSNVKIACKETLFLFFQTVEKILKDAFQSSCIDVIVLLLFFDIIENHMVISLRNFLSFITLLPDLCFGGTELIFEAFYITLNIKHVAVISLTILSAATQECNALDSI